MNTVLMIWRILSQSAKDKFTWRNKVFVQRRLLCNLGFVVSNGKIDLNSESNIWKGGWNHICWKTKIIFVVDRRACCVLVTAHYSKAPSEANAAAPKAPIYCAHIIHIVHLCQFIRSKWCSTMRSKLFHFFILIPTFSGGGSQKLFEQSLKSLKKLHFW